MKPFVKVKHIRVTKDATLYNCEVTCPSCEHFAETIVSVPDKKTFDIKAVDFETKHSCANLVAREKAELKNESSDKPRQRSPYNKSR